MRALLVEDDMAVANLLGRGLMHQRHTVDVVYDGNDGLDMAQTQDHDALIVDVMLPGVDVLELVRQLRADTSTVLVLILTARDALRDRLPQRLRAATSSASVRERANANAASGSSPQLAAPGGV